MDIKLPLRVERHRLAAGHVEYVILDSTGRVIAWTTDRQTGQELTSLANESNSTLLRS